MTVAKPKMFSFSRSSAVIDAALSFFKVPDQQIRVASAAVARPSGPEIDPFHHDRSRYARLLEKELDRQILTKVEREDTDMLDRVRSALYAD